MYVGETVQAFRVGCPGIRFMSSSSNLNKGINLVNALSRCQFLDFAIAQW